MEEKQITVVIKEPGTVIAVGIKRVNFCSVPMKNVEFIMNALSIGERGVIE